jgi:hypothetical protein
MRAAPMRMRASVYAMLPPPMARCDAQRAKRRELPPRADTRCAMSRDAADDDAVLRHAVVFVAATVLLPLRQARRASAAAAMRQFVRDAPARYYFTPVVMPARGARRLAAERERCRRRALMMPR